MGLKAWPQFRVLFHYDGRQFNDDYDAEGGLRGDTEEETGLHGTERLPTLMLSHHTGRTFNLPPCSRARRVNPSGSVNILN
jgi:hypothetical protein